MWDLDQIVSNNNQAALNWMMKGLAVENAQSPVPEAWALTVLADKLKVGPPLIQELINCLENIEDFQKFLKIIREFLPEHELAILSEPRNRRIYRFNYLFGQKYYPLPLNTDCGLEAFCAGMPVELLAMSYSAYHDLEMRPGYLLALSLVIYPYEGDERDLLDDSLPFDPMDLETTKYRPSRDDINWLRTLVASLAVDGEWIAPMGFSVVKTGDNAIEIREAKNTPQVKEVIRRTLLIAEKARITATTGKVGRTSTEKVTGARLPLLDRVRGLVGNDLVERVPPNGWHPDDLRRVVAGTPYDGLADFADWVCSETGTVMLDSSFGDCEFMEGYGEPTFKWTRRNVDILTKDWPKVQAIRKRIDKFVEWLEADRVGHFRELLDFLLEHEPKTKTRADHFGYDPTEHSCELDQKGDKDEDNEE